MTGLITDADVEGQFRVLLAACQGPVWGEIWAQLAVPVHSFQSLGLPHSASDLEVWLACQSRDLVLVTGNRNQQGPYSLEAVIATRGTAQSLPVLTLANRERLTRDRVYAERVAARLIERLIDIDQLRGSGRLYLP